ncbi:hypothetical protein COCOBI_10-3860 [Coccomyxa sp. Obi]|nr:hypothetical protein COCOBI_10-3860 [Coccomyxa sp. Obi]
MDASTSQYASDGCTGDQNPPDMSKDYLRQERIKAKNRRAQKKYREKKMHEVDQYRAQIKELNAKMRQMAEEKRALQVDKDRLERIMQSGTLPTASSHGPPPPCQAPRTVNSLLKSFPFLQASREEQLQQHRQVLEKLKFLFANGAAEVESSPAHSEAIVLMQHMRELQQILVHMFPFKAARIKADIQQQACREVGPHTPALWRSVVAAAKFSPLQRQQLIALRAKFLKEIDEVVAERRILTQGIKAMLPHPGNMSGFSNTLFKAQLSTSQLRANLEREYQLVTHFVTKAVQETITPIQHARCMVAAAPHMPDILYICSQLYLEDTGAAVDLDLLPDMNTITSAMSSYWWVTGQDMLQEDSWWPAVYQGLDVHQEPFGAASPATPTPAASLLINPFSRGAEGELPADAIAALLAADSLPLPEELDPCHTVEPPAPLRWET